MTNKPAVKITDNLYLGDKHHVPDDAKWVAVCSRELLHDFVQVNHDDGYEIDEIVLDKKRPRAFYKFTDWAKYNKINIQTTVNMLTTVHKHVQNEQKVYVHCVYGVNRSASHVFMYMVGTGKIQKPTFKKAMQEFRTIYPGINPIFGWKRLLKEYFPYNMFFGDPSEIKSPKEQAEWNKRKKIG